MQIYLHMSGDGSKPYCTSVICSAANAVVTEKSVLL